MAIENRLQKLVILVDTVGLETGGKVLGDRPSPKITGGRRKRVEWNPP
jgi:hypothetical protein